MSVPFESTTNTSELVTSEQTISRDELFGQSDFSEMSDHPIEQADWFNINSKLRQFGYNPVILSHVNKFNNTTSGYIILDEINAHALRNTVESLLNDCERKQDLLQEFVLSSNSLQRELDELKQRNEDSVKEILSLKASLKSEEIKCQELCRRRDLELQSHSEEVQKLVNANSNLQNQCKKIENAKILVPSQRPESPQGREIQEDKSEQETFANYVDKSVQLRSNTFHNDELQVSKEQSRHSRSKNRQNGFRGNDSQMQRTEDNQEVIDGASGSQSTPSLDTRSIASTLSSGISDAGFLYKRLKTTERKFKEAKKFIKEISDENVKLRAELNKRPKSKEWKRALVRNKQMENLLLQNNISTSLDSTSEQHLKKCTHVDDIGFFPIDVCRKHLKEICKRVEVTNLNDIPRKLDTLENSFNESYKMEKILRNLLRTVKSHEKDADDDESVCSSVIRMDAAELFEVQWKCLVPTIKIWRDELRKLKNLAESVSKISDLLLPWKQKNLKKSKQDIASHVTVEQIQGMLNEMCHECKTGPIKHRNGPPRKEDLQTVVEHFMKLFDVEAVSGTFARMNDVYVKNSEMSNILHTLSNLLGLDENTNAASIVNAVGTLAKAKHLLHIDDLDTVIERLDKYDDFYLAFKSVISDLMEILGVDSVDEIVPSVRALVRFP